MKKEDIQYLFCDLDGTLIKTVSGKTFPEDATDFRIRKEVLDKIGELPNLKWIGIASNQGGIPKYYSLDDFLAKMGAIETFLSKYLHIAVTYSFCTALDQDDPYRKPNIGMLNTICYNMRVDPRKIPIEHTLMIGDASGKPGQWSDTDKKTAENFGIEYMDVEDFIHA